MLIYPADRITEIEGAGKFGITANIARIDFGFIMARMKKAVTYGRNYLKKEIAGSKNLDYYNQAAQFSEDYTLELKKGKIRGKSIFIASGSRPFIPTIQGLSSVDYVTNESVLRLKKRPKSLIIVGGGYIGVEYGHFFAAMGTKVTILGRAGVLVPREEPELSALLEKALKRRMEVHTGALVIGIKKRGRNTTVSVQDNKSGRKRTFTAERIMIATSRVSNADLLKPENTGVRLDERRFIAVDDTLRTSKENIWAVGDAIGRQMFTHAGDKEAEIAWHNATQDEKISMDFDAVPHAVFTHPQIASTGLTEAEAGKKYDVLVGTAKYSDIAAGDALAEKEGFAKAIVEKNTRRLLGFHVIGPYASLIIQEAANAIADKADVQSITDKMHAFPTLPELIPEALGNLRR